MNLDKKYVIINIDPGLWANPELTACQCLDGSGTCKCVHIPATRQQTQEPETHEYKEESIAKHSARPARKYDNKYH